MVDIYGFLRNGQILEELSGQIADAIAESIGCQVAARVSVRECRPVCDTDGGSDNRAYEVLNTSCACCIRGRGQDDDASVLYEILATRDDEGVHRYASGERTDLGCRILRVTQDSDTIVLVSACAVASPGDPELASVTKAKLNSTFFAQAAKKIIECPHRSDLIAVSLGIGSII